MERIILVTYNKPVTEGGIGMQHTRKYYTNNDTLEEAIEIVRVEFQNFIDTHGGEIVEIKEE